MIVLIFLFLLTSSVHAAEVRGGAGAASGVGALVLVQEVGPDTGTRKVMWKIEGKNVKQVTPVDSLFLNPEGTLPEKFSSRDEARKYISALIREWLGSVSVKDSPVFKAWYHYIKQNEVNQLSYHLKYRFKIFDKVKNDYTDAVASWRVYVYANGGYATSNLNIYTANSYIMHYLYLARPDEPLLSWVENSEVAAQLNIPFGSLWLEVYDLVTGTRHTDVERELGYCSPDPATGEGCMNYKMVEGYDPVYVESVCEENATESENVTCLEEDMDATLKKLWDGIIDSERQQVDPVAITIDYGEPADIPTCNSTEVGEADAILSMLREQGFSCDNATGLMMKLTVGRRWISCDQSTLREERGKLLVDCIYHAQMVSSIALVVEIDRYHLTEPFTDENGNLTYTYLGSMFSVFPVPVKVSYTAEARVKGIVEEFSPWLVFKKTLNGRAVRDSWWFSGYTLRNRRRELVFAGLDPDFVCDSERVFLQFPGGGMWQGEGGCPLFSNRHGPIFRGECQKGHSPRYGENLYGMKVNGLVCYRLKGIVDQDGKEYEAWKLGDLIPDPFNTGRIVDVTDDTVNGLPRSSYGMLPPVEGTETVNFCRVTGENPCTLYALSYRGEAHSWRRIPPGMSVRVRQGIEIEGCSSCFYDELQGGVNCYDVAGCRARSCSDDEVYFYGCRNVPVKFFDTSWEKVTIENRLSCRMSEDGSYMITGGSIYLYPSGEAGFPDGHREGYVCCCSYAYDVP